MVHEADAMHMHQTSQPPRQPSSGTNPWSIRTLVVVARDVDALKALPCLDGTGVYDQVLLSPRTHAYAQIKCWHPSLVVVCTSFEDVEGCQLLTMLTVDPDTRRIPVLILTMPDDPGNPDVDAGCSTLLGLPPVSGLA
jgi:hypothetical protein